MKTGGRKPPQVRILPSALQPDDKKVHGATRRVPFVIRGSVGVVVLVLPLLAGCLAPAVVDPQSSAEDAGIRFPTTGDPFGSLLCKGDTLLQILDARGPDAGCNWKATHDSGPAAEVSIAVNPLDPLNLVGGSKDFSLGEDTRCGKYNVWSGVYVSHDGGRTWAHSLLPGHPKDSRKTALSDYACGSDPVIVFGPEGNVYYASIHSTDDPAEAPPVPQLGPVWGGSGLNAALVVTRSRDGGSTWDDPVMLQSREHAGIYDKEWIAADPQSGRVYVSYFDVDTGGLYVQRSDDEAQTWTTPVEVAKPGSGPEGPTNVQFAQVGVGSGGLVHFMYVALRDGAYPASIYHRTSADAGVTWSEPVLAASFVPPLDLGVAHKYRVVGMPALAVDAQSGSAYIAYPNRLEPFQGHGGDSDIYVVASKDGGKTWQAPTRVNDDLLGPQNDQWMPAVAVGPDGTAHVTWIDYRDDPAGQFAHIRYSWSPDGGRTWSPNARLTDVPFDGTGGYHQSGSGTIGDYMGLAASSTSVTAFWADTREGRNDVFAAIIPAK